MMMPTFQTQNAKRFFDEMLRVAQARSPGLIGSSPSDPMVILSESIATVAAMLDQRIQDLPQAVAHELPGLFGLEPQYARPARAYLQITLPPKFKETVALLAKDSQFQVLAPEANRSCVFRNLSALQLFRAGLISLSIAPNELLIGLEMLPAIDELSLYLEIEGNHSSQRTEVEWSAFDGVQWIPVSVRDLTQGLYQSGTVTFKLEGTHIKASRPKSTQALPDAFWLRASYQPSTELLPIRAVYNNVVLIENSRSFEQIAFASSNGHPSQKLALPAGQLAGALNLFLVSRDHKTLTAWKEVDSFFLSTASAREFRYESSEHAIHFGDGQKGAIPEPGFDNLILQSLNLCDGSAANFPRHSLVSSEDVSSLGSFSLMSDCQGGTNAISRRDLLPHLHTALLNRDRAITLQDFQDLALKSNARIGRVFAVAGSDASVRLVPVLKKEYAAHPQSLDLTPLDEDILKIKNYVEERRLLNSRVSVEKPQYQDLNIYVNLMVHANPTQVHQSVEKAVQEYFSPLSESGAEVELGKSFLTEELHRHLERIPQVFVVRSVKIENAQTGTCLPLTTLPAGSLPRIRSFVRVEEMRSPL